MIKAVITDFDGVLRHWNMDIARQVELSCKLELGSLSKIAFQPSLLNPAITGKVSFEQWESNAHDAIKTQYGTQIANSYIEAWRITSYTIDHDLINKYRRMFPDAQLCLATNATSRFSQELVDAKLEFEFEQVFNSSVMGIAKPHRGYFNAILISLGLKSEEVVFIDDSKANCESSAAMGIHTIQFRYRKQCMDELIQLRGAQHMKEVQFQV